MFTALLDSCVLWPSLQRDFLLSLTFEGAYRFIFSKAIPEETEINEELKLVERGDSEETARQKTRHLADPMRASFGAWYSDGRDWKATASRTPTTNTSSLPQSSVAPAAS
jgi:hypothetical protein